MVLGQIEAKVPWLLQFVATFSQSIDQEIAIPRPGVKVQQPWVIGRFMKHFLQSTHYCSGPLKSEVIELSPRLVDTEINDDFTGLDL
jgi:hypothetical protein